MVNLQNDKILILNKSATFNIICAGGSVKKFFVVPGVAFALLAVPGYSQSEGVGVTVSATTQFPSGDMEKHTGFGYGGIGAIEAGGDNYTLTASSGYIQLLPRGGFNTHLIPLMAGLKISTSDRVVYMFGEGGAVLTSTQYSGSVPGTREGNENNLGWSVGVGSVSGPYDLRFSFHVWDVSRTSQSMSLGLSFGFTTWSN